MAFQGPPGSLGRHVGLFRAVYLADQPPKLGHDLGKPGELTGLAVAPGFLIVFFRHALKYPALEPALTCPGD